MAISPEDMTASERSASNRAKADAAAAASAAAAKAKTDASNATRAALTRLTSGATLTAEERTLLNMGPVPGAAAPASTTTVTPAAKTINRTEDNGDGTYTVFYSDGTQEVKGSKIIPGSTGTSGTSDRTLAKDTFTNTLSLLLGTKEASQPWVAEMYTLVSGFYNTGSTIDEALNLGLYDAKAKGLAPQFTKRFDAVFKLQEKLQKGEAVTVPTIAEFIKTESAMGDTLREAGLGDLATQEFLGTVIGNGKSQLEVGNLIASTFSTIDNAPKALDTLDTFFPSVSRVDLAKALLTGTAGAAELDKKIKGISVLSAAGSQGISTDLATASDIAARGVSYEQALTGFGEVKQLQRANTLAQFGGDTFTQGEAIKFSFENNQAAQDKAVAIKAKEIGRFQGASGLSASALRGRNARQQV